MRHIDFAQVPQCTDLITGMRDPVGSHYCHVACKNGSGLASLAKPTLSSQCAFPDAQITLSISLSSSVDLLRQLPGRAPFPQETAAHAIAGVSTLGRAILHRRSQTKVTEADTQTHQAPSLHTSPCDNSLDSTTPCLWGPSLGSGLACLHFAEPAEGSAPPRHAQDSGALSPVSSLMSMMSRKTWVDILLLCYPRWSPTFPASPAVHMGRSRWPVACEWK